MCDPPGVVGVEPSVVLDLLHPRSAGSSTLALPLRPDVRFTACTSVGVSTGVVRSGLVSLPVVAATDVVAARDQSIRPLPGYLPGYLPGVATPGADIQWTSS